MTTTTMTTTTTNLNYWLCMFCFVGNIVYLIYIYIWINSSECQKKNKQSNQTRMGDTPKMKIDRWDILWIFLFFYFFFENTDNIDDDDKFRICNIIQLLSSLMSYIYVYDVYGWFNRIKKKYFCCRYCYCYVVDWLIDWLMLWLWLIIVIIENTAIDQWRK